MLDYLNIFNSADINNLFTYYNQNMDYWSYLFCKLHTQTCFCPFSLFDIKWTYLVLSVDGSIAYTILQRKKKFKYSKLQQGFDLTVAQILILIYIECSCDSP